MNQKTKARFTKTEGVLVEDFKELRELEICLENDVKLDLSIYSFRCNPLEVQKALLQARASERERCVKALEEASVDYRRHMSTIASHRLVFKYAIDIIKELK